MKAQAEEGKYLRGWESSENFLCSLRSQYVFVLLWVRIMDLLKACEEMKDFIGTAQKFVSA